MNTPLNYLRSLAALFLGFLTMAGSNTIFTALLRKFLLPTTMEALTLTHTLCLLAAAALAGLVGGYVVAALAGSHRWQHALLLAGLIACFGVLVLLTLKDLPRADYTTYVLIVSPLSILAGGMLRARKADENV